MKRPAYRHRVSVRPARLRYRTRAAASVLKPALKLAVLGGLLAWGGARARDVWEDAAWFRIASVGLVAETPGDAPPDGFERAVGLAAGDRFFGFSAKAVSARLKAQFPELAEVDVARRVNGSVGVSFRRRTAKAKTWSGGEWLGMDEEGALFPLRVFAPEEEPPRDKGRTLPILAGAPAGPAAKPLLAFVDILGRLPESWARTCYKMKLTPAGDALLFLKDGPRVYWGAPAPDEAVATAKSRRLERVLRDQRLAAGAETARFVDDRRIAVKLKAAAPEK